LLIRWASKIVGDSCPDRYSTDGIAGRSDVTINSSAICNILRRLGPDRLPASQRYQRRDRRHYKRYDKRLPGKTGRRHTAVVTACARPCYRLAVTWRRQAASGNGGCWRR